MILHQYDYLFAIGTIFAFFDAWGIGANDVANSWATSVSSRSVTYLQAMMIATVMEFGGAVGVGARVADTIRTKIVNPDSFIDSPGVLMLGMVCAVMASATWLATATKLGFPVSTTHTVLGGVLGFGVASVGAKNISWVGRGDSGTGIINSGVVSVFLAWIIAPVLAGCFGAGLFLLTKFAVLMRKDPIRRAFVLIPFYFGMTGSLLTTLLLTKGGSVKSQLTEPETAGVIVGVGVGVLLLIALFWLPWLWRVIVEDDWQLRYWHFLLGPLLLRRGEVPPPPENHKGITDYYAGHLTLDQLEAKRAARAGGVIPPGDVEAAGTGTGHEGKPDNSEAKETALAALSDGDDMVTPRRKPLVGPRPQGRFFSGPVIFWWVKRILLRGVDHDIVELQRSRQDFLTGNLEEAHGRTAHFDNKVEYMYSFLQVVTASVTSFTHGANDAGNAIGPYATIYQVWQTGKTPEKKADIPLWILFFLAASMAIGLWTYGYRIMINLGNRITLISPSRGFCMELGSAITIIIATKYGLPVSTTQCITGGTVGVGLCNGDWRTINWRMVTWIYFGWIVTVPVTAIMSGVILGFVINAPRWAGFSP